MKNVIILQGLPGAGKSYFVNSFKEKTIVCSADDYFYKSGKYIFEPSKLSEAHRACFRKFIDAIQYNGTVIVDNTNTTAIEIAPYVLGGEAYGCTVEIIRILCDPEKAFARNIHNVPEHAIYAMNDRIMKFNCPPWWKVTTIKAG